jgi:sulfate adenylyltransferase large subunit
MVRLICPFLTDGLRAEREQGITIDVAYRSFSTAKRKFIIADTPGHEQYTRNMATGASTAHAAVILIDGSKGLLPQTRRHACITSLLGIRFVIAAVNKMDLVDYREDVFRGIDEQFEELARRLGIPNVYTLPISALGGDNIVSRSSLMPWFKGPTLLEHLETVPLADFESSMPLRLPIQCVIRPTSAFRGFAGQITSGKLYRGTEVIALPSKIRTHVQSIVTYDGELDCAGSGASITVTLEHDIDLGRGDMLVDSASLPRTANCLTSKLVWFSDAVSQLNKLYLLKHTTRVVRARIGAIYNRIDCKYARAPSGYVFANERYCTGTHRYDFTAIL